MSSAVLSARAEANTITRDFLFILSYKYSRMIEKSASHIRPRHELRSEFIQRQIWPSCLTAVSTYAAGSSRR